MLLIKIISSKNIASVQWVIQSLCLFLVIFSRLSSKIRKNSKMVGSEDSSHAMNKIPERWIANFSLFLVSQTVTTRTVIDLDFNTYWVGSIAKFFLNYLYNIYLYFFLVFIYIFLFSIIKIPNIIVLLVRIMHLHRPHAKEIPI